MNTKSPRPRRSRQLRSRRRRAQLRLKERTADEVVRDDRVIQVITVDRRTSLQAA